MYRRDLDALKGIAIIVVVLFHMGLLKSGYLGVDIFFVINGFFVIPSLVRRIAQGDFSFWNFVAKKIIRFLPLIVLASVVCLIVGYFLMLPDHYENLAQTVIASNFMSENILSAITTKNYWDVVNDYKPLMHLWYVGILMEFYIVVPLLLIVVKKCASLLKKSVENVMVLTLSIFTMISLVLYFLPSISIGDRFYYLPFRFFELGFGGLISIFVGRSRNLECLSHCKGVQKISLFVLLLVVCCSLYNLFMGNNTDTNAVIGRTVVVDNGLPLSSQLALLATVFLTTIVVGCKNGESILLKSRCLSWLGKMSYSIFIWHQVLLAFYRYLFSNNISLCFSICFITVTIVVSVLSYYFVEKKISLSRKSVILWCIASLFVVLPSGYLYLHAGVVRNVPELDVMKGTEHRGMFGEYCDRVYQYKQFPDIDNGKMNVLVEGVSFGRDFANVLLESEYKDSINLVYIFTWKDKELKRKVAKSDYIFCFSSRESVPGLVWNNKKPNCIVKGISTKNYGECNGIIYKNRLSSNYFNQTLEIEKGYKELNEEWKSQWGDNYIDLLTPAMVDENRVRVFTDDFRFISQDCRHLTQAGAQWYARNLNWKSIFDI